MPSQPRAPTTIAPRIAAVAIVAAGLLLAPRPAVALSVLAHQAVVDEAWDGTIVPALRRAFPGASSEEIARARAYAHGGSHIADLGYFPLGQRLFTDLVHYVRSGDFFATLVRDARTIDELAFALGGVSHHVTDGIGHPEATNRTVPEIYPKLERKYGETVTYAEDPRAHLETEFRFDVLAVARNPKSLDLFRHAVEFEVAKPLLERAFRETYGIDLSDVFEDENVAITTYRWAFRGLVHEATGIAWQLYRADIERLDPTATAAGFAHDLSRADFETEFGKAYRQPGYFAKFVAFLVKLVPNVGPLKRLPSKPLPADAQQRFAETMTKIVRSYERVVARAPEHPPALRNVNLDTGQPVRLDDYAPADKAYASLLDKLDDRRVTDIPPALRTDIRRFCGSNPSEAGQRCAAR
jgi:hypothetical protein